MTTSKPPCGTAGRRPGGYAPNFGRLRDSIDNIDAAVVHMLAERFSAPAGRPPQGPPRTAPGGPRREARQIERLRQLAENAKLLTLPSAEKFLNFIISEGHPPPRADRRGRETLTPRASSPVPMSSAIEAA